jgi:muramoyltetrapeptide carboxypeptidase LdcA involved in peptidoglycan recycling
MDTLDKLGGILLGRPGGAVDPNKFGDYEKALVDTVRNEFNLVDMPMVTNMDFGHTDPMFVMPIGVRACINSAGKKISINESAVD